MRSLSFLVLLLFLCEGSVEEVQQTPQIHDVFQTKVSEQTQIMGVSCAELKTLHMTMEQGLKIETLKEKLSEQAAALKTTQDELSSTKNELQRVTSELEAVKKENSALNVQLTAFESRMVQVEKTLEENSKKPKVAFSVGLTDSGKVGNPSSETSLIYTRVLYNMGTGYNPITGIFTAPTKGAYYFRFTGYDTHSNYVSSIIMFHNQKQVLYNTANNDDKAYKYYSNGIILEMEERDVLYLKIPTNTYLFDDSKNHCTLTGFLLFPL